MIMSDILHELAQILEQRKGGDPEKSYVASLYAKGLDTILKKNRRGSDRNGDRRQTRR